MACYHPSQMFVMVDPSTGALTYKLAGRTIGHSAVNTI